MSAKTTHFRSVSLGPRGLTKRYTGLGYYVGCRISTCIRTNGQLPDGRVALRARSTRCFFFGTSVLTKRMACSASGRLTTGLIALGIPHVFRIVGVGHQKRGPRGLSVRKRATPGHPTSLIRRRDLAHFSGHGGGGKGGGTNKKNGHSHGSHRDTRRANATRRREGRREEGRPRRRRLEGHRKEGERQRGARRGGDREPGAPAEGPRRT